MIGVVVQARMRSKRLPGKVLSHIAGKPMLQRVVERVRMANCPATVMVATTNESDNPIVKFCQEQDIEYYAGDEHDVLGRTLEAAVFAGITTIVRVTSDCPLIDPEIIDAVTAAFCGARKVLDYMSNVAPPTFPDGLNVEVVPVEVLRWVNERAIHPLEREHVTLYIRRNPSLFRMGNFRHSEDLSLWRWSVDYPADMAFVRQVYQALNTEDFGMADVLALLREHPDIARTNAYLPAFSWRASLERTIERWEPACRRFTYTE